MDREAWMTCLEKASERFACQTREAAADTEADDMQQQMQEEELARLVAQQMGLAQEEQAEE
jgi:hypothetical protein